MTESLGDNRAYHGDLDGPADYGALLPHFVGRVLVTRDNIEEVAGALVAQGLKLPLAATQHE